MNTEIIFWVEDSNEGGYEAKALGESIFTEADTLDQLKENVKESVLAHFDEGKGPSMIRLEVRK